MIFIHSNFFYMVCSFIPHPNKKDNTPLINSYDGQRHGNQFPAADLPIAVAQNTHPVFSKAPQTMRATVSESTTP